MSRVPVKTRDLVRARDEGCVRCGIHGGNVHHRMLRSQAPKSEVHNITNLIIACGSGTTGCHGWIHAHPTESYFRGWLVNSWEVPADVAVLYPDGSWWYLTDRGTRVRAE